MVLQEIQRSRMQRADKSGAATIYGVEVVYTCPQLEAGRHETRLWQSAYTQLKSVGPLPVMSIQVVGADPNQPGNSLLTVTYGRDLSYDPSTFQVGSATISLATRVTERPLTEGPGEKGAYIETGPDKDGLSWRIVGGATTTPHVDALISVRTAYEPAVVDWIRLLARLGKVNRQPMGAMMGVDRHQAMLIHANVPSGFRFGDPTMPIPIEYVFWVKPTGWLARTTVQRYIHLPLRRPVVHEDTLEKGELLYVNDDSLVAVRSLNLAAYREMSGSYAFGKPIPVGGNSEEAFAAKDAARSKHPQAYRGDPRTLPEPVETADFTDILQLIERGTMGS